MGKGTEMVENARVSPQLKADSIEAVWGAFVRLLESARDAVPPTAGQVGREVAAGILAPLVHDTVSEMESSGVLDAQAEIVRLAQLDEDWDADGGLAVTPAARDQALHLLLRTLLAAREDRALWARPAVSTAGDGGVDVLWSGPRGQTLLVVAAEPDAEGLVLVSQPQAGPARRQVVTLSEAVRDVVQAFERA
jgi:hypothetical protein